MEKMEISLCVQNRNLLINTVKTVCERLTTVKTKDSVITVAFNGVTFEKNLNLKDVSHTFYGSWRQTPGTTRRLRDSHGDVMTFVDHLECLELAFSNPFFIKIYVLAMC